jgi:hypothetical protein
VLRDKLSVVAGHISEASITYLLICLITDFCWLIFVFTEPLLSSETCFFLLSPTGNIIIIILAETTQRNTLEAEYHKGRILGGKPIFTVVNARRVLVVTVNTTSNFHPKKYQPGGHILKINLVSLF